MSCFEVEVKDGKVWIVNNIACHIDGEPFKYRQVDECRAEMLCTLLNELSEFKAEAHEIITLLQDIKYANADYSLDDVLKLV